MIWATVSSQSCFCWLYRASPSLATNNIISLILVLTVGWCPCVESSVVLLEEGVCYDQCVLLAKLVCRHSCRPCTLLTKVCLIKAMVFPVVMYGCESWTIKKAECQRADAFELWCWRRVLRVPWPARRSNQSVLNIHWKDWCWSWSSNTLANWCKDLTQQKRPWCWERLKAGEDGDSREWDSWMASPTQWTEFEEALGVGEGQGSLTGCSSWGLIESEGLSDWTELKWSILEMVM